MFIKKNKKAAQVTFWPKDKKKRWKEHKTNEKSERCNKYLKDLLKKSAERSRIVQRQKYKWININDIISNKQNKKK